jgi:hypothetical protein
VGNLDPQGMAGKRRSHDQDAANQVAVRLIETYQQEEG